MADKTPNLQFSTRHGWIRVFIKNFESNPHTQLKIHLVFTYFWLVNMVAALSAFLFLRGFWNKASVIYLVIVSLYANFATDYGAVSAAEAAATYTGVEIDIQESS